MSTSRKILVFGLLGYVVLTALAFLLFGSAGRNDEFKPQDEFTLYTWINLPGSLDINKAVLYLVLSACLTIGTMFFISRKMQQRPNRTQTAVETLFGLMKNNITRGNMDDRMAAKWFPFIGTIFLFIWFSNMLGYLPLPTNTEHSVNIFGAHIPSFALYAATANLSVPLVLTIVVWCSYHVEGIRAKGFRKYLASWIPAGVEGVARAPIFVIEVISHLVRLVSLSVRLFANILAGHLLILFMGGGLVATLQAFIFATLTAIYLGGAVAEEH